MEVGAPLVADGEAAGAGEPRQHTFHNSAVAAEPLTALDAAPSDPWRDAAGSALAPATAMIVSLVGVQFVGLRRGRPRRPVRTIRRLRLHSFVMENVPGLENLGGEVARREILEDLELDGEGDDGGAPLERPRLGRRRRARAGD